MAGERWSTYCEFTTVVSESMSLTVTISDGRYADGRPVTNPQGLAHMRVIVYGCNQEVSRSCTVSSDNMPALLMALCAHSQDSIVAGRLLPFKWEGVRVL